MNLAAREAIVAEFGNIQPEHLLAGILKFSELEDGYLEKLFPGSDLLEHIKKELRDVRAVLKDQGIDSTSLRKNLRKALGKGGSPFKGNVLHRSYEARQIFIKAEELSLKEQTPFVTINHFLRTILKSPSALLEKILGAETSVKVFGNDVTDDIRYDQEDFQERDLVFLASSGQIKPLASRKVQAHALERYVIHSRMKPVLLIGENELVVRECFETMICELISRQDTDRGENQQKWTAVEVILPRQINEPDHLSEEKLRRIIRKASDNETDIVVITGHFFYKSLNNLNTCINILKDEIVTVKRSPCVMLFVQEDEAKRLSEQHEAMTGNCHQVVLYSNPHIQIPDRIPVIPSADRTIPRKKDGDELEQPLFFNGRAEGLKDLLYNLWKDGFDKNGIGIKCFLSASLELNELAGTLSQFLGMSMMELKKSIKEVSPDYAPVTMIYVPFSQGAKRLLAIALELAIAEPDNLEPGLIDLRHVAGAMAISQEVCNLLKIPTASREDVMELLAELFARDISVMGMGELAHTLKELRSRLQNNIFGQDQAINAFADGLFSAEVVATAETDRNRPKAVFIFSGPPGVGKTYLAECGAKALGRPFQRFDMSSYSDHQVSVHYLTGMQRSYQGANSGRLTGFVNKHPNAVLLFDEIEKAHLDVIHLFLQILDHGVLEDQFTEESISFCDTTIIFTTNAGRQLYEDPNASGVHIANTNFQRKTILNALENEKDQSTGKPFFPQTICSRMAEGYPLMFNHLGVNELERIAATEMKRMAGLLEKQYYKDIEFGPLVPMCIVLREGAASDARTIRSQAESFVKSEMFQISRLFKSERFDSIMENIDRIIFALDSLDTIPGEIKTFMEPQEKPKVVLVADEFLSELWSKHIPEVEWKIANDTPDVLNILSEEEIDFVLLDLWFRQTDQDDVTPSISGETQYQFDHVPAAANVIKKGQELLRMIHEKHPEIPCYLLTFGNKNVVRPGIDDELFHTCVHSGGARGVIETTFLSSETEKWKASLNDFITSLITTAECIFLERKARELASQHKVLTFDTAPYVSNQDRSITVRLRNFRLTRAMDADDVLEILHDVERPTIGFADVYGADAAKLELKYIVNWLKNPRQYSAMGLRPPRGILLYGHPGTGKTMLARALAGECNTTFIVDAATNFVTKYVGSGPENVRNLFIRARRYAPTILFIDEIDAIGRKRGEFGNRAYDETLNAILTEMEGFEAWGKKPVIVIAAANLVEHLDDALRRRFDREIEVDKPDRAARADYLKNRLQGKRGRNVSDEIIKRMAGQSTNMTIAELERVVELAGRKASFGNGVITDQTVEDAFEQIRMGEMKGETDPQTLLRVARHEAGHCLIGWLRGEKPVQITIVARGKTDGFVEREADENRIIYSKSELEGIIRQSMGGRAAEIIYYGDDDGLTTGAAGDLQRATHYAGLMVRDYGMEKGIGQVAINPKNLNDGPLAIKVLESVEKIINSQLIYAIDELRKHRKSLDHLVERLMEKNRLTRNELEIILG